ncbi:[LSU ribosomal protein L11P]-lysine N-methyltransferase [Halospina denitrificans]|uniref:Ribosomal protein L11 methyltransferase n=1 Tax=Halospina denitrificans TaxID=332522 RepID=A0A4R7JQX2_9GAMM|nr:50S ribosomal protein L11 methyltransferase [Halospina denitrificans]TDT40184.1 [LSU ribosomal protein L11P]-lysine N-methyltransferase [Halospina denitrificans]
MPWVQLHIQSDREHAELLEELLLEAGAEAVSMEDSEDTPLYEPERGTTPLWDSTRVTGLFQGEADLESVRSQVSEAWHAATQTHLESIETELLEDREWERAWMDDFRPERFGDRLWICPSWQEPPDPEAVNLVLDPGLAFGSGTHPTTRLCLEWLDQADVRGLDLIDYGCGSGILGLAALKLGARHMVGVDNDPQALDASRDNAQRNGISDEALDLYLPEEQPSQDCSLMLANILAQPLLSLAPTLAAQVRPGGRIVLSGILSTQANSISDRYARWFSMESPTEQEGWVCITGTRYTD